MSTKSAKTSLFKVKPRSAKSKAPVSKPVELSGDSEPVRKRLKRSARVAEAATAAPELDGGPRAGKVFFGVYNMIFQRKRLYASNPFTMSDASPSGLEVTPGPLTLPSNRVDPSQEAQGGEIL
jgi:hypothetical protein